MTFAREQQLAGKTAFELAIEAGHTRIRPVLMTAAAMIVGMIPMAIGGAGEEQNAALARAVIGGLLFATPTTLLVVPYLFAVLRRRNDGKTAQGVFYQARRSDELRSLGTPSPRVPDKRGKWRGWLLGLGVLFVLAAGLAFGAWRSYSQNLQAVATTQQRQDFVPTMRVQAVRASGEYVAVTLPATTAAFSVANIFARASGYIDKRNVDIGDHVKEGQLLVQIVAPELDHQIAQAKATLAQLEATVQQTQANKELARVTWGRDSPLVDKGWVAPQQGTIDVQTLKAQEAAVGVAEANVAAQRAQIWCSTSRRPTNVS